MTCKSGAPTQDGSKSSSTRTTNLLTGTTTRSLMLKVAKTKKDTQLEYGQTIEENTNNGQLFILIKQRVLKLKD